jgi:hypothetical protein
VIDDRGPYDGRTKALRGRKNGFPGNLKGLDDAFVQHAALLRIHIRI